MLKFAYTILYVQDVEKSIAFYEAAFGFERKFIAPGNQYGELATGAGTTLSFATVQLATENLGTEVITSKPGEKPFGIEIGFTTDDVTAAVDNAVKAGAILITAPKTKPWGQIVAYVRDIDGFLVELCTSMG